MTKQAIGTSIASLLMIVCLLTSNAEACSCQGISPCAAYEWAKAVFVGKLVSGTEKNVSQDGRGNSFLLEAGYARFEIEEAFKGVSGKEVTVFIDSMKNTSCYWGGYEPGARYLVFAGEQNGMLAIVSFCNPSKKIQNEPATETREPNFSRRYWRWNSEIGLKFVRSLATQGANGRLFVTAKMLEDDKTSVRGASIMVKGEGDSRFEAITDEYGEAVIENLPPGKYTVTSNWPKGITGWHQPEIEITERGCSELKASAIYSGLISGRVLDGKGQPAQSVEVHISSVDDQEKGSDSVTTKENGFFEIGNILPGKYYLYFQTSREDQLPYFYPGVFDKTKAITITIGLGEKSEGIEFTLPSAFETQTIKGKVVMPDGKPVAKATIYLKCPIEVEAHNLKLKIPEAQVATDSEGNFIITGFKGVSYSIKAVLSTSGPNSWSYKEHIHSPLIRVLLTDDPIELRLILSDPTYGSDCDDDKRQRGQR